MAEKTPDELREEARQLIEIAEELRTHHVNCRCNEEYRGLSPRAIKARDFIERCCNG